MHLGADAGSRTRAASWDPLPASAIALRPPESLGIDTPPGTCTPPVDRPSEDSQLEMALNFEDHDTSDLSTEVRRSERAPELWPDSSRFTAALGRVIEQFQQHSVTGIQRSKCGQEAAVLKQPI